MSQGGPKEHLNCVYFGKKKSSKKFGFVFLFVGKIRKSTIIKKKWKKGTVY